LDAFARFLTRQPTAALWPRNKHYYYHYSADWCSLQSLN
jgi:hypothetical protein